MGRGPERGSQSQIKEAVHGSDRKWLMAPGTAQAVQGQPQPVPPTVQAGDVKIGFSRQTRNPELYV